mgnify:CR=1 FL=1|tara:strand:+ start:208 stop:564 length:357 start_codon:yes stop_codon:yes gene_type:complete
MIHIRRRILKLRKKINVEEWNRFEEIADIEEKLWDVFWTISKDKKEIEKNKICRNFYFQRFVLASLHDPLLNLSEKQILTTTDIEIVFSLFLNMLPKYECEDCECVSEPTPHDKRSVL